MWSEATPCRSTDGHNYDVKCRLWRIVRSPADFLYRPVEKSSGDYISPFSTLYKVESVSFQLRLRYIFNEDTFGGPKVFQLVPRSPSCHRSGFSFWSERSRSQWTPLTTAQVKRIGEKNRPPCFPSLRLTRKTVRLRFTGRSTAAVLATIQLLLGRMRLAEKKVMGLTHTI